MISKRTHVGKRDEQKAATRERILEVARTSLETQGFEATNLRAIAQSAGISVGTILLHFQDKQDLLHCALFNDLTQTWELARNSPKHLSLVDDLQSIVQAFFDYYRQRPAVSRALLRESLFASPPWSERFAQQVTSIHAHVADLTRGAIARGEIRSDIDPVIFGASFFSFYYFSLLAYLQGGHPTPEQLFAKMLQQHLAI